jgi:hypothetical protein
MASMTRGKTMMDRDCIQYSARYGTKAVKVPPIEMPRNSIRTSYAMSHADIDNPYSTA